MSIEERFDAACATPSIAGQAGRPSEPELLPTRLSRAAVAVLSAAGAGISALAGPELRLPVGASDDTACYVERLQFTYGDGPCLRAYRNGHPVTYPAAEIARMWPEFHRDLTSLTPYRAITSLPLLVEGGRIGAMDLYLLQPDGLAGAGLADATAVAARISRSLSDARIFTAAAQASDTGLDPDADRAGRAAGRIQVWRAMGLLNLEFEMSAADALAVLRGRAYSSDRLVDELADDIVAGRLGLDALRP